MVTSNCKIEPQLDPITFIGGNSQVLVFPIFDEDNRPIDIEGYTYEFVLCRYDIRNSSIVLKKNGKFIDDSEKNKFEVHLESKDTKLLEGKYLYQLSVIVNAESTYEIGQGFCTITRNLNR